jgi:hypothetical protein
MTLSTGCLTGPSAVDRRAARASRYALRYANWSLSSLRSVKACAKSVRQDAGGATISIAGDGRAGFSGLNTCSSVSACPCCSARIREQRSREIEAAGVSHIRRGGGLGFTTLTLGHKASDTLLESLNIARTAWKAVRQDQAVRALLKAYDIRMVRAWEVTYTSALVGGNGWHPHLHVLWFADRNLDAVVMHRRLTLESALWVEVTLRDLLHRAVTYAWSKSCKRSGRPANQFDTQAVRGNAPDSHLALTRYLTKVQDSYGQTWGVGREMASGPSKKGRKRSLTPFQLLEWGAGLARDDKGARRPAAQWALDAWHEYEQGTKGLRVIESSRGLFAELGVLEVVDELAPEAGPDAVALVVLAFDDYKLAVRFRVVHLVLDAAERQGIDGVLDEIGRCRRRAAAYDGQGSPGRL